MRPCRKGKNVLHQRKIGTFSDHTCVKPNNHINNNEF